MLKPRPQVFLLTFLRGGVDGPRQLGVRLGRLGGDHHVGAVSGRLQSDGFPDAATRARDEERAAS